MEQKKEISTVGFLSVKQEIKSCLFVICAVQHLFEISVSMESSDATKFYFLK